MYFYRAGIQPFPTWWHLPSIALETECFVALSSFCPFTVCVVLERWPSSFSFTDWASQTLPVSENSSYRPVLRRWWLLLIHPGEEFCRISSNQTPGILLTLGWPTSVIWVVWGVPIRITVYLPDAHIWERSPPALGVSPGGSEETLRSLSTCPGLGFGLCGGHFSSGEL